MKTDIHPEYVECRVYCSCGNDFTTRATVTELRVELCAECHPFYTGKQKLVDTGGRVERFERRYAGAPEAPAKKDAEEEGGGRTKATRTKTRKAPVAARPQRAKFEKPEKGDDAKGDRKGRGKGDAKGDTKAEAKDEAKGDQPAEATDKSEETAAAEAGTDAEA